MNIHGINRRVDELGRIVIPVEIRRLLNIKEGENLEFIIKNEALELKKISYVVNNKDYIVDIGEKLNNVIDGDFFISDRNEIIYSSDKEIINKRLPYELHKYLLIHENTLSADINLSFENKSIHGIFNIFPFYSENDIAGMIVTYNSTNVEYYKKLISFVGSLIHDKLSL